MMAMRLLGVSSELSSRFAPAYVALRALTCQPNSAWLKAITCGRHFF
jgi:hypothetical protein